MVSNLLFETLANNVDPDIELGMAEFVIVCNTERLSLNAVVLKAVFLEPIKFCKLLFGDVAEQLALNGISGAFNDVRKLPPASYVGLVAKPSMMAGSPLPILPATGRATSENMSVPYAKTLMAIRHQTHNKRGR